MKMKKVSLAVIVLSIWLLSAAIGVWEILLVREMVLRLMARFVSISASGYEAFRQINTANSVGIALVLILAVIWIAAFIGSAEYHYRRLGQPSSWKLLSSTVAVEIGILLLVLFV
jgi:hypothetical protein